MPLRRLVALLVPLLACNPDKSSQTDSDGWHVCDPEPLPEGKSPIWHSCGCDAESSQVDVCEAAGGLCEELYDAFQIGSLCQPPCSTTADCPPHPNGYEIECRNFTGTTLSRCVIPCGETPIDVPPTCPEGHTCAGTEPGCIPNLEP